MNMAQGFIQSVENGEHPHCPPSSSSSKITKSPISIHGANSDLTSEVLYAYEHFYGSAPLGQVNLSEIRSKHLMVRLPLFADQYDELELNSCEYFNFF